ncbi:MATE family efflux transporter, partial [Methanosphaera sp. WGK6]|uniref:MATE family efflux transporter n=1 Tax=Methanosphaera sp. WGK6 TaxID=1561964 RepID=UPI000AA2F65D
IGDKLNQERELKDEAHTNEKIDLIRGDPKVAIRAIAWPMILTLVLNMIYNMVDRIWVAGLGSDPLAALGFVTPLFIIIGGLANGFGAGANSLISRYIGAKNTPEASNSALHGVLIALVLSILIPIILLPSLNGLLNIMGASSVLSYAKPYATIIIIGSFTIIFNGILSSELRAEGDVKRATIALAFTGILNMIIDPIFIYTLGLGVNGAAIATIISAFVATALMIYWMFIKKDTYVTLTKQAFTYSNKIMKQLIAVALPASLEQLIISLISIILNALIAMVASTVIVAGFTAAFSIVQVGMMTSVGIGTAAITVAGVAYGARDFDKVKTACHYSIKLSMIVAILIVIIMEIFAPQLALLFSYSSTSANLGPIISEILRIVALFLVAIPIGLCCANVFQGIGKGTISLVLTLFRELILVIVFAVLFIFVLGMGHYGVYWGMVLGSAIGSILGIIVFESYLKRIIKLNN